MIFGTGIDIIEIARVRKAIAKESFIKKVYSPEEISYCQKRGQQSAASFAARFAAKEAVVKALGTGHIGGSLTEIESIPDAKGCPQLRLSGYYAALAEKLGVSEIKISLSHSKEYAVAQAIAWRNEK